MPPELVAALTALLAALAAFIRSEVAARRQRERLKDVEHKVGADRRRSDS